MNLHSSNITIRVRPVPDFSSGEENAYINLSVWTRDNAELVAMAEWDSADDMLSYARTLPGGAAHAWKAEFWI